MNRLPCGFLIACLVVLSCVHGNSQSTRAQEPARMAGLAVVPHRVAESMRYRRPRDPSLAARVQMFVQGSALPKSFDGKSPAELLATDEWACHDMAATV